jgi:hypothetical protein
MERRKLAGLRPQSYEHPADAQALNVLVDELTGALRAAPARFQPSVVKPFVTRTDFE